MELCIYHITFFFSSPLSYQTPKTTSPFPSSPLLSFLLLSTPLLSSPLPKGEGTKHALRVFRLHRSKVMKKTRSKESYSRPSPHNRFNLLDEDLNSHKSVMMMRSTPLKDSYPQTSSTHSRFHLLPEPTLYDNMMQCLNSSKKRNWLSRYNGDDVNIKSLRGKVVGLFFMPLTPSLENRIPLRYCILDLASCYNELSKSNKGKFEIVLIAQGDCKCVFDSYLKMMPWLAIPFMDSTTRNNLYNLAAIKAPMEYELVLFDCDGQLLRKDAYHLFKTYGADWYPFTDKRLGEIRDEDDAIRVNKSLKKLLGNPTRDFVIANDGRQVPISCLEEKVVGIFICNSRDGLLSSFMQKLYSVYDQLKEKQKEFEIVMVYVELHGWWGRVFLMDCFQCMDWLALPHMDSNTRRVQRIFNPADNKEGDVDRLIIVGPHGQFINNSGRSVVEYYGAEAYPFSRVSAAQLVKRRLEKLSLKSLLSSGGLDHVISTSGEKIKISDICGKRKTVALVFIESVTIERRNQLLVDLTEWYNGIKQAEFKVILVPLFSDAGFYEMPFLTLPYDETRVNSFLDALDIITPTPTLSVFGPDGKLVCIESEFHFCEKKGRDPYFFCSKYLSFSDVYCVLAGYHGWPSSYEDYKLE